ncbi:glycosyl transferase [Pseudomonas sp. Bc-h]|jgi:glycosyltransferase involved in cell wall biosynthesis|uniref:glycosyltransferase n=1 Tax=Pseudomonas sp. Bc-h TaxID=1943632 RepID=UPI0009DAC477|nr:glycosyltransferase [Pseudomonas sp. Bc-h]OQR30172.1 glycosyl transferase [Pseudomonas sp. Bc-h]
MIGIIVPAHNEQDFLDDCIKSLIAAASHQELKGEVVEILIVLDDCSDDSALIAHAHGVLTHSCQHRNVGMTRAAGAKLMIERGARWLAFTDADSVVPYAWLADQVAFEADAVCGIVHVNDWSEHPEQVRTRYDSLYRPVDDHRHIHGANLGVSSIAYQRAGGFKALAAHEDVHLVEDLQRTGARIVWTARNSVSTSARKHCRCKEGFGDYLNSLATHTLLG